MNYLPETTKYSMGVYGDGALGHQNTRERCADVLDYYVGENFTSRGRSVHADTTTLIASLRGEMPDDAWDELEAEDWLNEHAPFTGAAWGWRDGDFGLWSEESES